MDWLIVSNITSFRLVSGGLSEESVQKLVVGLAKSSSIIHIDLSNACSSLNPIGDTKWREERTIVLANVIGQNTSLASLSLST